MSKNVEVLYGAASISEFLGWPVQTVRRRARRKELPVFRIGRQICAQPDALRQWLYSQTEKSLEAA